MLQSFPHFSLPRSSSVSSSVTYDRRLSQTPSIPENKSSESFTGLHDTEHRGQHSNCPACRKTLQKLHHHRNNPSIHLGMFSLPQENTEVSEIRDHIKILDVEEE